MRFFVVTLALLVLPMVALCQPPVIQSMRWQGDYRLEVRLGPDSTTVLDARGLYHQKSLSLDTAGGTTTYLPVDFDADYIKRIKQQPLGYLDSNARDTATSHQSLWAALHNHIGGGYVHMINCLIYALETGHLNLADPLLQRPRTSWKPNPPTESYLRTKKWPYYAPHTQRLARKEYKLRKNEGSLQDLEGVPSRFIELFLKSSDRDLAKMRKNARLDQSAQIMLVQLMLGAKYLGEKQIAFISDRVRETVTTYTGRNLPSVIIFDDLEAAVAMRLSAKGYQVERIVFQSDKEFSDEEFERRKNLILGFVQNINRANEALFQKRLATYYH